VDNEEIKMNCFQKKWWVHHSNTPEFWDGVWHAFFYFFATLVVLVFTFWIGLIKGQEFIDAVNDPRLKARA
jgi:hypothetical protein